MSCEIFDMIVAEKGLLNDEMLTEEEVDRVKAMILAGAKGKPLSCHNLLAPQHGCTSVRATLRQWSNELSFH
jgi:hypothetical protein